VASPDELPLEGNCAEGIWMEQIEKTAVAPAAR
jgi:hypothetical protein